MVRCNGAPDDCLPVTMVTNFGMLLNETVHEVTTYVAPLGTLIASSESRFRCRLIATTTRRKKHDGRQEIVRVERRQQCCGWHLRHAEFQNATPFNQTTRMRRALVTAQEIENGRHQYLLGQL